MADRGRLSHPPYTQAEGLQRPPGGALYRPHYLAISDVDRQVYVPKGARSDLPHQLVFTTDNKLGLRAAAARHDPAQ